MLFQILLMCHSRITIFSKLCVIARTVLMKVALIKDPLHTFIQVLFCVIHISNIPGNQLYHWMAFCKCCTIYFCGFNVLQKFIRILCLALNLTNLLSCIFWCIIHSFFFSEKRKYHYNQSYSNWSDSLLQKGITYLQQVLDYGDLNHHDAHNFQSSIARIFFTNESLNIGMFMIPL